MRLIALTIALFVLITLPITNPKKTSAQEHAPSAPDVERLEAEFKELDAEDADVTVEVSGNNESSGKFRIKVQTTEYSATASGVNADNSGFKINTRKDFLIEFSKLNIPDAYLTEKIAGILLRPTPTGSLPGVKVRQIDASDIYEVVEDYTYNSGTYSITVKSGFRYDRASIPRPAWIVVDKDSLSNVAPLFHDLLYRNGGVLPTDQVSTYRRFTRKDVDDLFYELMGKCGVKQWRRDLAYQAVRTFSGFAWKGQ